MPVGAGDILQVTLVGDLIGQTIMNTFHYGVSTVTGTPTQSAFSAEVLTKLAVAGGFYDKFLGMVPDNYTLSQVWVQFVLDTRYRKSVANPALPGTSGSTSRASNFAAVISRFGGAANRRNQGAVHIPIGGDSNFIADGLVTGATLTAMGVFAPFLFTPLTLATLGTIQPVLIHGTSKLNAIPLVTAEIQATSRVMRRRTLRVGI